MITEALQHCPGVGPVRLARLNESGIRSWHDVLNYPDRIPAGLRGSMLRECSTALDALQRNDIRYFVDRFTNQDKWRILTQYHEHAACFDIETTGLEYDATISVIVCWHRGRLHTFVEHENLDDFLELLDDIPLLVSFNGCTFDVPRVLDAFHIPQLPCPHIDLRWPCYHRGLTGSLKSITQRLGFSRPHDLRFADGEMAVQLWADWLTRRNHTARSLLLRYCGADVLLLKMLAHHVAMAPMPPTAELWSQLQNIAGDQSKQPAPQQTPSRPEGQAFGPGSPSRLRARR